MKIKSINLDEGKPTSAIVELSLNEMIWIGKIAGQQSPVSSEKAVPGFGFAASEIYGSLTDHLFNRFWSDGLDEAMER